jgi:hypothetical protein
MPSDKRFSVRAESRPCPFQERFNSWQPIDCVKQKQGYHPLIGRVKGVFPTISQPSGTVGKIMIGTAVAGRGDSGEIPASH